MANDILKNKRFHAVKSIFAFLSVLFISLLFPLKTAFASDIENARPLYIGLDADMSAVAAEGGIAIKRGIELAINNINENGGVLGRPLELIVRDHRGNPARGLQNIVKFSKRDDLIAVFGGVHTPVVLHELDEIHKQGTLFLVPWAAGTKIVDNGYTPNNVFRVSVRDAEAGKVLASFAEEKGFKNVTLVLERTGWGRSNNDALRRELQKRGIGIDDTIWVNWRQKTFDKEIRNLETLQTDAILLVANAPEGALVVNNIHESGLNIPILSHWGIASGNFVKSVADSALQELDIYVLQTFHFENRLSENLMTQALFTAYRETYDANATPNSIPAVVGLAHAYDLTLMLASTISNIGKTDIVSVREALKAKQSFEGVVKTYNQPFAELNDALVADDYFMTKYNADGELRLIEHE